MAPRWRKAVIWYFLSLSLFANLAAWTNLLLDQPGMYSASVGKTVAFIFDAMELFFPMQLSLPFGVMASSIGVSNASILFLVIAATSLPLCYFTGRFMILVLERWNAWIVGMGYLAISIGGYAAGIWYIRILF